MQYVCDAPDGKTWFRIETEAEAVRESQAMRHAVEKHYRQAEARAAASYDSTGRPFIEQDIGRKDHLRREMPVFMTLRDREGEALATAMLPPTGADPASSFRSIIVGPDNGDPYVAHAAAIRALADHVGMPLDRSCCYPYRG